MDFKEEKIKKGKARIIKYYLTTNEGRVVLGELHGASWAQTAL